MSRKFDPKLSGWVDNLKDKDDFKFVEFYYNRGPLGRDIYRLVRYAICGQFGYYAIFNEALITSIHGQLGRWSKGLKFVKETIAYLGELGILDKSLLKHNILTSADIQESWLKAKQAKRAAIPKSLEYWLLSDIPSDKDDNCSSNNDNCNNNRNRCNRKADKCTIDKDTDKDSFNRVKYTYIGSEQDYSQPTAIKSFKCRNGEYILSSGMRDKLISTYKNVSVDNELKKMELWFIANPQKLKTVQSMPRFIIGWLNKSDDVNQISKTKAVNKDNKNDCQQRSFTSDELGGLFVDIDDLDFDEV